MTPPPLLRIVPAFEPSVGELALDAWPVLVTSLFTVVAAGCFGQWFHSQPGRKQGETAYNKIREDLVLADERIHVAAEEEGDEAPLTALQMAWAMIAIVVCMATMLFLLNSYPVIAGRALQARTSSGCP